MTESMRGPKGDDGDGRWVTVTQAAAHYGITHAGMRNRILRGRAESRKSEITGFREVWLPNDDLGSNGTHAGSTGSGGEGTNENVASVMAALEQQLSVKDGQIARLLSLLETALSRGAER
jgi:hypothetical protein